jgi:hypothetical protein
MNDDDGSAAPICDRDVAICTRILDDTIAGLAVRFGVVAVVAALTEVVGCHACVTGSQRGAGMGALIEKMAKTDPST